MFQASEEAPTITGWGFSFPRSCLPTLSSGGNFLAALKAQEQLDDDAVVVTVFADDNKKDLSTDLLSREKERTDYLAPHIELKHFSAMKRVCQTCCEADKCNQRQLSSCERKVV